MFLDFIWKWGQEMDECGIVKAVIGYLGGPDFSKNHKPAYSTELPLQSNLMSQAILLERSVMTLSEVVFCLFVCLFIFKKCQIWSCLTNITIFILSPGQVLGKPKRRRLRYRVNLYIYISINVRNMCEIYLKNVIQRRWEDKFSLGWF